MEALRLLIRAGSDLTLGSEDSDKDKEREKEKGPKTPYLKMVRAKLKLATSGGPNAATSSAKKTIQLMIDELQAAFDARKAAMNKKTALAEAEKVEAISHDDDELVEFYEKTRGNGSKDKKAASKPTGRTPQIAAKEQAAAAASSSVAESKNIPSNSSNNIGQSAVSSSAQPKTSGDVASSSKKKKKGDKEKEKDKPTSPPTSNSNNKGANSTAPASSSSKAGKASSATSLPPSTIASRSTSAPAALPSHDSKISVQSQELSVASRDELVDRLLAMGFKEADCLAAISLYGTDVDRAISWLCEKPASAPSSSSDSKVIIAYYILL